MRALVIGALLLTASATHASVRYDFEALSSLPDVNGESFTGSFSYLAQDFIVPPVLVPVGALTSCTLIGSLGPRPCGDAGFRDGFAEFGLPTVFVSFSTTPGAARFFHFTPTAFGAPGRYDTVLFGTAQQGVLVVSNVPEPASWALMIGGFGLVGGALRQSRRPSRA